MIRGIYTSASGMMAQMLKLDTISNNLANAMNDGFKKDLAIVQSGREMQISRISRNTGDPAFIGSLGVGCSPPTIVTDFSPGVVKPTGNPLDVALNGSGFFAVETPNGTVFTRDGSFAIDREGYLVTKAGFRVLGSEGHVFLPNGDVEIAQNGQVYSNGEPVNALIILDFPEGGLSKVGENIYMAADEAETAESDAIVLQGNIEMSNVNTLGEMVEMITANRAYEASQKILIAQDETLGMAVREIAVFRG